MNVKMTLTAPGCGMGPAIAHDAQCKILTIEGVDKAEVQLVWDPSLEPKHDQRGWPDEARDDLKRWPGFFILPLVRKIPGTLRSGQLRLYPFWDPLRAFAV